MKITNAEWKKRLTAGLLAIAMLCGVMPPAVMAEDTENLLVEVTDEENVEEKQKNEKETPSPEEDPGEGEEESEEGAEKKQEEEEEEQEPLLNMPMLLTENSEEDGEEQLAAQEGEPTAQTIPTRPTLHLSDSSFWQETDGNTITISNSVDLITLSNVLPNEYCDKTIQLSPTSGQNWNLGGDTNDGYTFLGLGGKGQDDQVYPFSGELKNNSEGYSILTTHPLFNNLSTDAKLAKLQIGSHYSTGESDPAITSTAPLLAGTVTAGDNSETKEWSIKLVGDSSFGGLIGTLESGTVKLTVVEGSAALSCAPTGHAGLFCNTMKAGTTLTAVNSATGITVNATGTTTDADGNIVSSDAGGFVGRMEDGATLTASGKSVASVTSEQGNAGGIVGSAENAVLSISDVESPDEGNTVTVSASQNAGGIVGDYVNSTQSATLDLSNYTTTNVTISGGSNAGGVFGALTNNTGADNAESAYTIQEGSITVTVTGSVTNFGGLIGYYSAGAMHNTLSISNVTVSSTNSGSADSYGGVIGSVGDNSYVEIEDQGTMTVTTQKNTGANFGGLVGVLGDNNTGDTSGAFLYIGNVSLGGGVTITSGANAVGGLVGALKAGVVRLHGTTDLRGMAFSGAGGGTGQIVGKNTNGLVYAVGTGNASGADGSGWLLKRPTGSQASDIGNWGQVVRLDGEKLTEKSDTGAATDLLAFDETNHTVTVLGSPSSTCTISSARDFAAYALHYDFSSANQAALKFSATGVAPNTNQTVTINDDIDLTGTGILGIGRDDGKGVDGKGADDNYFVGTISGADGTHPTITLDIGSSAFGEGVDENTSPIGKGGLHLFSDGHNFLGLLPVAGETTKIKNLEITGAVKANSGSSAKGRVAGAIGYCKADNITFDNVTVSADVTVSGTSGTIYQGGFFGDMVNGGNKSAVFQNCIWSGTLDNSVSGSQIGGFAAYIQKDKKTITVADCTLSGTITARAGGDAHVGGLFADFQDGGGNTTVTISKLSVSSTIKVEAQSATSCGGFLGYSWPKTNVTFGNDTSGGVTISGATLTAPSARFGGLVYQATGYWNATANNSIKFTSATAEDSTATKTQISGKSETNNPSGLLVGTGLIEGNALYLEVGTWGSGGAYYVEPDSVALTLGGSAAASDSYFDELVGETIADNEGHNNAVVSLATPDHALIDNTTCNTYTGQIDNFQNGKTRYYYNLDSYREGVNASNLTSPGTVLCWSVSQYAAGNIKGYFCSGDNATIIGTIDLPGYSYYPVSPLGSVSITGANLTFAYAEMNGEEAGNKPFDDRNHQHYMMHYGLLYDVSNSVSVTGPTRFSGTVGKDTDGSGALIFGTVTGNPNNPVEISLQGIMLNGLRVSGELGDYAPLLINKNVNGGMKLTVDNLGTGAGYSADTPAATSLIGKIGGENATKLTLEFKNIALDGRKEADSTGSTSVNNNGTHPVSYNTTKTIFTNATLLESFQYLSDSTGVYNFNSDDTMVTYGYEISDSKKNPGEQYKYYDTDDYAWDGVSSKPTSDTIGTYYLNYLPYVYKNEETGEKHHELDVNLRLVHLDVGCGTHAHPYEITDGKQLEILANYLATGRASNWVVCVNKTVCDAQCDTTSHNSGDDHYYLCDGETWFDAVEGENGKYHKNGNTASSDVNKAKMYAYLRNAYYQINEDITIASSTYMGIGGNFTSGDGANAFSGTIMGESGTKPTVYISSQITGAESFGGLVRYSQGSVIKDLTVSYAGRGDIDAARIGMTNNAVPGTYDSNKRLLNNPFFGGVVGYCMGGDTIIDNVSVNYGESSVTLSGTDGKERLIAAGGYVGLVGGAKNKDGYEKTGGGVVFRGSCTNNFADYQTNAGAETTYFYCNPYVGRVLDGYACAEDITVNNTDKNYQIPKLDSAETTGLSVNGTEVTVSSEQGLWLLSAIVNSGAGAMDSGHKYNHQYAGSNGASEDVDAYNLGKPRTASYDNIGGSDGDIIDETFWGGVENNAAERVSYLVRKYTAPDDNGNFPAAKIAGGNPLAEITLVFSEGTIDMSTYGNGFRGIGSSFAKGLQTWGITDSMQGRFLRVGNINPVNEGETRSNTTIKLGIDRHDYSDNYYNNGWFAQGAGLFIGFAFTDRCTVGYLTLTGKSKLTLFDINGSAVFFQKGDYQGYGEVPVGGFAGRTANSSGTLNFDNFRLEGLSVYGGHHAAGAIGLVERTGGITFNNWYLGKDSDNNVVSVSKKTYNDGSSAGLLGWCYGNNAKITLNGVGMETDKWNVDGVSIITQTSVKQSAVSAGLIGACDGYSVTISGVRAKDVSVSGTNMRECGGLADGSASDVIQNCFIKNVRVTASGSGQVGGILGKTSKATVTNCHLVGTEEEPTQIEGNSHTSGLIGVCNGNTTIKNCTLTYVDVLSTGERAGGLVGQMNGSSMNASNVSFSYVNVVTKSGKSAGLLTGHTNGKTINGYNILADSCKVGYNASASMETLNSVALSDNQYTGLWFGQSTGTSTLVAVAVDGTYQPQKDVGTDTGTTKITYADYPVDQTNTSGSASPYLDVNPEGTLKLVGKTYTGNGVGYLDSANTTLQNSIPYTILSKAAKTETSRHYYNVINSDDFTFSDIVSTDNNNVNSQKNIRLRTFAEYLDKEENQTLTDELRTAGNFPLLVVDNLGGSWVTAAIWNYIAALTNVSSGAEAKNQTSSVTPTTYQWDGSQFKTTSPTMTVSGKGFFCSSNAYDNGKMQFTLLDVKYANPTDDKHTGFHLYVPVLVKKIMDAKVNVSILAGTSYLSDDYDANTALYATAGFDEPVTAYITYNYSRSQEEWQSALNDGSNLLWYYEKTLNLTGDITPLPVGTKLTLVNAQSGQMYYHAIESSEVVNSVQTAYKLEEHFVNSSRQQFVSSPICDMLNISADPVKDGDKPANRYVVAESKDKATVKVDGTYYRLYNTETDEDVEDIFCLTVGDGVVGNEGDYLSTPEGYYLTIQIPKMDKAVNNTLFIENEQSLTKSEYALPVRVKDNLSDGDDARHYVIYDGLNTPTISTVIRHYNKNGEEVNSPEMQNGDSIEVQLESTISLTTDGVSYYRQGYAPAELYHQFLLSMRKKDENGVVSASLIGAEDIHWTYTIDGETIGSGTEHPRDLDVLTLKFGTKETHLIEKLRDSGGHSVTVGATITLRYGNNVSAVFPERAADDSKSGLYVHTESRVAADSNLLPTTGVKAKKDETDGFFCSSPSNATMSYDAIEKYGTDGKTLQLGINPLDRYSVGIRAEGIYDYSAVSETTLGKADTIRYTLELFQKGENGEYVQVSGGKISSYLPVPKLITNITDSTGEEQTFTLEGDSYQLEHDFTRADSGNEIIVMDLEPKTGSELEEASGFYANYRVRWTAVMLDGTDELSDTLASDYIVYTNAKILQKLVSSSEQNENT